MKDSAPWCLSFGQFISQKAVSQLVASLTVFRLTLCLDVTCPADLSLGLIALMLYGREYGLRIPLCVFISILFTCPPS